MRERWLWAAFWLLAASSAAAKIEVKNLATEFQAEPLAVDTPRPRFSFELVCDTPACELSAGQVQLMAAERPEVVLWDSGRMEGLSSNLVSYSGPPLQSRSRYAFRVRAWNETGEGSPFSPPAFFNTGILPGDQPAGRWIWEDADLSANDYAYFRTSVNLPAEPVTAYALVSAHNHYLLYINGRQVSGFVSPGPSNPYKSKYYVAYSLAPFLREGENVIAAVVHYKGREGQSYIKAAPGFYFEGWVKTAAGERLEILSGPSWKVLADTPYDENAPFLTPRQHTAAEYYDARKEPGGWTAPGFDDSGWRPAQVVEPGFVLKGQLMPESRVVEAVKPVKVSRPWPGVFVFDLGKEISGGVRLRVSGPAGTVVQLRYSDRLLGGRVNRGAANEPTGTYADRYILSGRGGEIWEPRFGYRGFRYVEVSGFPGVPAVENLEGLFIRTDLPVTAAFESSNPLLNRIYQISVHTQAMNMVGQLVDCVHREQSQWHADAEMESGGVFYNFYEPHIVRKTLLDLADGQFPDGRLPANYPSQDKWLYYIPEWDLHYVPLLFRTYFYYDDREILAAVWPTVKKQIAFFESWRDGTGLVVKSPAWHINDWPEDWAKMDQGGKYLTVENCLYYETLRRAADLAEVLGEKGEAESWRAAAAEVRAGINRFLFDPQSHSYLDCSGSAKRHAGASVLPLQYGIVPEEEKARVLEYVKSQGFSTSVCLTLNLLEMLYAFDETEFAYSLINKETFPGWGYMIKQGDQTTWESWFNYSSRSHPFNAYLSRLFLSEVAGVRPVAAGWREIEVRPHLAVGLEWVQAAVRVLPGRVSVKARRGPDGFDLEVTLPGNTRGRICLPASDKAVISESGFQIYPAPAASTSGPSPEFLGRDRGYLVFRTGAGSWSFRVADPSSPPKP